MKKEVLNNDPAVSIIIPVYNEERVIGKVLESIKLVIDDSDCEIIIVNDGSTDKTRDIVEEAGVRVINHPYNIGNGAAIKTGIRNARGQILVMMDGDGQHNPEDIPILLKFIPEYDMVVGARTGKSESAFHRNVANKFYNLFASYITGRKVLDLTSGLRAIKRDVARKFVYLLPNSFSYPSTITLALFKAGHSVQYVPIKTFARTGKSKINLLKDGTRFILIMLRIATLFSPFRVFFPVSVFLFILALGYACYKIFVLHASGFTNTFVLLSITTILVFLLGLISEQIAQLRLERSED